MRTFYLNLTRPMMNVQIKNCDWCDAEFLRTRFDKKTCSKKCSAAFSYSKHSKNYKSNKQKKEIKAVEVKIKFYKDQAIYDEVNQFIFQMKSQHFIADAIDVFRLVDLFDKVFPTTQKVPNCNNIDKSVNIMFFRIVNWWRISNSKKPLPAPNFSSIK